MKRPLLLFITLLLPLGITQAATRTWIANEPGDWYDTANWNGGNLPAAADTLAVTGTGTIIRYSGTSEISYGPLAGGASMLIQGDAFHLVTNAVSVPIGNTAGSVATLTLAESGSLKATPSIYIASVANSAGIVTVKDNARIDAKNFYVNYHTGTGTLLVSGSGLITTTAVFSFGGLNNGANFGTATTTLQDHAAIRADGQVFFGSGTNILNIESDQVKITKLDGSTPAVILGVGNLSRGTPRHDINFNHSGTLTFDNQIIEGTYEAVWFEDNETYRQELVANSNNSIAIHAISGVTKLTATNIYSRGTTVSDGATLIAAHKYALGVGDVTIEADSTLKLALDAPAIQTFSSLSEDGDTFVIGGDLTVHGLLSLGLGDTVDIGGSLLLDGGLEIRFTDSADLDALTSLDSIFTVSGDTDLTGLGNITATDGVETYTTTFTENGTLGAWETQPIPEPSTWFLLGAGLGGLALFVIRRRREDNLEI
ncbi:MAG: PEP-CTERM sorting domain-containing protein [Verrucomicrobiales bacterium]|jgi:hypothetical protein|nr:PEP-CTERM sorting domain-containing protein [Verrucomicrobiales bacterium]